MSLFDDVLEQLQIELVKDIRFKVYAVCSRECDYCENGVLALFFTEKNAIDFALELNKKSSSFDYFIRVFEVYE